MRSNSHAERVQFVLYVTHFYFLFIHFFFCASVICTPVSRVLFVSGPAASATIYVAK